MRVVGRYALYEEIASGGMATVHFGRLLGPVGFSRTVAIKRLHPQFAKDPEFVSMFLDEARVAARIRHPNVVPTIDVVATQGELFLVMDYVQGESLSKLIRATRDQGQRLPSRVVATIVSGALSGLHAAHEARDEHGEPLNIVHRDISPQNILVGQDGAARVLDFGVAKAAGRVQTTRDGQLKGKLAYMAPEQLHGTATRQTDVFAAAVVLWETLTTKRLFSGDSEATVLGKLLSSRIEPPSKYAPEARVFDEVVLKGLERDPSRRWATAREMAQALERCIGTASPNEVGEWVEHMARATLSARAQKIAEIESSSASQMRPTNLSSGHYQAAAAAEASVPPAVGSSPSSRNSVSPLRRPSDSPSQLSSISVSSSGIPSRPLPTPQRSTRPVFIVALLGLLLVGVIVVGMLRKGSSAIATAAPNSAIPLNSQTAAPSIAPAVPPVAKVENAPPSASAIVSAAPPPTVVRGPAIRHPAGGHATAPIVTQTTPSPAALVPNKACDPPFTYDASGQKKWKPECL